ALPGFEDAIDLLAARTKARTYREIPEAYGKLRAADPVPALVRTLRAGLLDELGWPEGEKAIAEIGKACTAGRNDPLRILGPFPYLIVACLAKAVVVSARGRVLEHELQIPKGSQLTDLAFS